MSRSERMQVKPGSRLGRYEVRSAPRLGRHGGRLPREDDRGRPVALKILPRPREGPGAAVALPPRGGGDGKLNHANIAAPTPSASSAAPLHRDGVLRGRDAPAASAAGRIPPPRPSASSSRSPPALPSPTRAASSTATSSPATSCRADGDVKLLDFGLSKLRDTMNRSDRREHRAAIAAAPSPTCRPSKFSPKPSRTAELFALGVVLYEMLAGRAPFPGRHPLRADRGDSSKEPPPLSKIRSDVPRELSDLVSSLLAKERDRRIASAAEVLAILREIGAESAAAIRISSGSMRSSPPRREKGAHRCDRADRRRRPFGRDLQAPSPHASPRRGSVGREGERARGSGPLRRGVRPGDRRGESAAGRRARSGAPHFDDDEAAREERSARHGAFSSSASEDPPAGRAWAPLRSMYGSPSAITS